MSYELRIARQAEAAFGRCDRRLQERILARLAQIETDPFGPYTKPLVNASGRRSARVGDWRIIFAVDVAARVVDVSVIGPRGRAYRDV
ncbi:MAG: type II toxin-antitoxin system RelE/ParE family toxin [Chloroflexi bacterium]|nr:type II toxin-antitoxin system RelE/ParE family toxin [Chloroflexota bacterium]